MSRDPYDRTAGPAVISVADARISGCPLRHMTDPQVAALAGPEPRLEGRDGFSTD